VKTFEAGVTIVKVDVSVNVPLELLTTTSVWYDTVAGNAQPDTDAEWIVTVLYVTVWVFGAVGTNKLYGKAFVQTAYETATKAYPDGNAKPVGKIESGFKAPGIEQWSAGTTMVPHVVTTSFDEIS